MSLKVSCEYIEILSRLGGGIECKIFWQCAFVLGPLGFVNCTSVWVSGLWLKCTGVVHVDIFKLASPCNGSID